MRCSTLALCALCATLAATARAQAPGSFTIKTNALLVSQQITKTTLVATFTGITDATVNGVAFKGLTFSATGETAPTENNVWGVIVGTLANGDQVFFAYHTVAPVRNGVPGIGTLEYKITGGTGTASGISGSGTCKTNASSNGGAEDACVGAYAIR